MNGAGPVQEVVVEDSEHEEGEISSEEEEDDSEEGEITCLSPYPSPAPPADFHPRRHPRSLVRRPAPVTSEVVIYDDNGRTAIFTSPEKTNSIGRSFNFMRASEGCKKWSRDEGHGRRERNDISRRREREEAGSRREREETNSRERDDGNNTSTSKGDNNSSHVLPNSKGKLGSRWAVGKVIVKDTAASVKRGSTSSKNRSYRRVSSSDTSSENTSFTISSASEDESIPSPHKPIRGEGKENKSCPSVVKHPQEPCSQLGCTSARPPPKSTIVRPPLHRKTSSKAKAIPFKVASRKEYPKSMSQKRLPSKHQNIKTFHNSKTEPVAEECSMEKLAELADRAGLKKPPPGSLGEMLLKKKIKNQLKEKEQSKSMSLTNQATESISNIEEVAEGKEKVRRLVSDVGSEGGLDQEDEDELQLRLLALQSSLRYLNDIRKAGAAGLSNSGCATPIDLRDEKKLNDDAETSQVQQVEKSLPLLQIENVLAERAEGSFPVKMEDCMPENVMKQRTVVEKVEDKNAFNSVKINESSDKSVQYTNLHSSPEHEHGVGGYELGQTGEGEINKRGYTICVECNGSTKDHQDSNQDPVDMDICYSSGDEGEDVKERDAVQVVKNSIQDAKDSSDTTATVPFNSNDFPSGLNEGTSGNSDSAQNNFQIPVEWAYMMPPPPPPDQPANNIDNFNSWCYDQNMYLQSMQVSYDTPSNQCCQPGMEGMNSEEWSQQQQMIPNSQWCSPSTENNEHVTDASLVQPSFSTVHETNQLEPVHIESQSAFQGEPEPKNLKDLPAEHYQAFMSAVLKQQTTPKKGSFSERTLIQVPIVKTDTPAPPLTKKREARKRKRGRQKRKLKISVPSVEQENEISSDSSNMEGGFEQLHVASQPSKSEAEPVALETLDSHKKQPAVKSKSVPTPHSGAEEEDEDVLRAQLLIDMSIRKQQKEIPKKCTNLPVSRATVISETVSNNVVEKYAVSGERLEKTGSYTFPPSSDLPSGIISHKYVAPKKKKQIIKSRGEEGSPSRMLNKDGRAALSDIGGFGLDPKSSQFYYQGSRDSSSLVESQKLKFPPIKPVIISLKSDSEDEEPPCGQDNSSDTQKEPEPEASTSVFSQSLDMLLKSMRNAKPASPSGKKSETPKASSSKVNIEGQQSDITPQAVRHLSRHQQVEYRRLKELLRKKEILQHKKMQQKRSGVTALDGRLQTATSSVRGSAAGESISVMNVNSSHVPNTEEWQGGGKTTSDRAVSWREMGRLKIQLSNIASTLDKHVLSTASSQLKLKNEVKPFTSLDTPVADSPRDTSATEEDEEDEETLRMMVLDTLKKNKKQREVVVEAGSDEEAMSSATEVNNTNNTVEAGKPLASLKVVIHQKTDSDEDASREVKVKNPQDDGTRVVMLSEGPKVGDEDQNDSQAEQDDTLAGEWMVLDQVTEDDSEASTAEECAEEAHSKAVKIEASKEGLGNCASDSETPKPSDCEKVDSISPVENMNDEIFENDYGKNKGSDNTNYNLPDIEEHCGSKDETPLENICKNNNRLNDSVCDQQPQSNELGKGGSVDAKNTRTSVNESSFVPYNKESKTELENTSQEEKVQTGIQSRYDVQDKDSKIQVKTSEITSETDSVQVESEEHSSCAQQAEMFGQQSDTDKSMQITQAMTSDLNLSSQKDSEAKSESKGTKQENCPKEPDRYKKITCIVNVPASLPQKKVIHNHGQRKPTQVLKKDISLKKIEQEKVAKLKSVEKIYTEKRHGMNQIISQLDMLVQEATQEEQQRQTLKKTVTQLHAYLADIESQLETKADALKIKMEKIRSLHKSILADRQMIDDLQKRGEHLGREVFGNNYNLPKLSMSPHSKTKDAHVKIALASSIDALRRVRDGKGATSVGVPTGSSAARSLKTSLNKPVKSAQQQPVLFKGKTTHLTSSQHTLPKSAEHIGSPNNELILTVTKAKSFLQTKGSVGMAPAAPVNRAVKRKILPANNFSLMKITKTQGTKQSARQGLQVQGSQHAAANVNNESNGLDEMSELCPHDLLGRCNDDACIYQHLAHPPSISHSVTQPRRVVQVSRGSDSDSRLSVEVIRSNSASLSGNVGKGRDAIVKNKSFETGVGNFRIDSKIGTTAGENTGVRIDELFPESGSGSEKLEATVEFDGQSCPSNEGKKSHVMCQEKSSSSQIHLELGVSHNSEKNESVIDNGNEVQTQAEPLVSSENDGKDSSHNQKIGFTECVNVLEEVNSKGSNDRDQNVMHVTDIQSLNNSENVNVCTTIVDNLVDAPVETYHKTSRHGSRSDGKIDIMSVVETSSKECTQEDPLSHTNTDRVLESSPQTSNKMQCQNDQCPSGSCLEERADEIKNQLQSGKESKIEESISQVVNKDHTGESDCSERPIDSVSPTDLDEVPVKKRGAACKRSLSLDCSTKTRRGRKKSKPANKKVSKKFCDEDIEEGTTKAVSVAIVQRGRLRSRRKRK